MNHFFLPMDIQLYQQHLSKRHVSSLNCLVTLVDNQLPITSQGLFLTLNYISFIYITCDQHYTILISIAL